MGRPGPVDPTPAAAWLATAGASAPFVGTAAGLWLLDGAWRDYLYLTGLNYALASLAFLGALQLGLALGAAARGFRQHGFWWVVPFLPAVAGLAALAGFVDYFWVVVLFLGAFTVSHAADLRAVREGVAPAWYRTIRKWVTGVVLFWGGTFLVHAPVSVAG